jgi:hypothetical protein
MFWTDLNITLKKNKLPYYARNLLRQLLPTGLYERQLHQKIKELQRYDKDYILGRVNYYNKLKSGTGIGENAIALKDMQIFKSPKAYNFDTFEYSRYFPKNLRANFLFGDVISVAGVPTIQKSRPIGRDNTNAVLLKLDKKRHFIFVNDPIKFEDKKDLLIGRGAMIQPHRIKFMETYFGHPLCDLGQVNTVGGNAAWIKPKISISEHLKYKFILSLEGHDVATNLKWIMSSGSVAVMPQPKYETWFMEGSLIPDHHYIRLKDDYSDLDERLKYYIAHPEAVQAIVKNANAYVKQFQNKRQEDLISLLVLDKYFYCTGQTNPRLFFDEI